MAKRPASVCPCGYRVPAGVQCPCAQKREKERKARADAARPSARERGYTSKWDKERTAYLKVNRKCCMCPAPATVVDHKVPHKGDDKLFWSRSNWQPMCASCHSSRKQRQERGRGYGPSVSGPDRLGPAGDGRNRTDLKSAQIFGGRNGS